MKPIVMVATSHHHLLPGSSQKFVLEPSCRQLEVVIDLAQIKASALVILEIKASVAVSHCGF